MYSYAAISIFLKINVAPPKKHKCRITPLLVPFLDGHLSTPTTSLCPQGGRCQVEDEIFHVMKMFY